MFVRINRFKSVECRVILRYSLCMRGLSQRIMSMSPDERQKRLEEASGALRAGGSVVMPTETVYGVFTSASNTGRAKLEQLTGKTQVVHTPTQGPAHTLHMGDAEPIVPLLKLDSVVARRLVHGLMPGPTRLVIRQPEPVLASICGALGLERGIIDDGESVAMRLPDHPIARAVIRGSGQASLARGVGVSCWAGAGGAGGRDLGDAIFDPDEVMPDVVLDDGPTLHGRHSTTVDLWADGRFDVQSGGAMSDAEVMAVLTTRVIFVCTGNTCRSPMAAGLARAWAAARAPDGLTLEIDSAGIAAGPGYPAADQAIGALGESGIDLRSHQSKLLTPEMVDRADVILTMTPSHAQAVMQMAPGAVHKVFPIDPVHPIGDPIGHPIEVYREVADQLEELVEARLKEILT